MITRPALGRTFRIRFGTSEGTCFSVDIDGRQYLLTAKHVVKGIKQTDQVEIFRENCWKTLNTSVAWIPPDERDIAVLNPGIPFCPPMPLLITGDYSLGQDCWFLGFPFGLHLDAGPLNLDFPLPLVRKATISMFPVPGKPMLLDGHNNPGFSGGPVVVRLNPSQPQLGVIGIISAYRAVNEPIKCQGTDTDLIYRANTGLVVAYDLIETLAYLKANPTGALISTIPTN